MCIKGTCVYSCSNYDSKGPSLGYRNSFSKYICIYIIFLAKQIVINMSKRRGGIRFKYPLNSPKTPPNMTCYNKTRRLANIAFQNSSKFQWTSSGLFFSIAIWHGKRVSKILCFSKRSNVLLQCKDLPELFMLTPKTDLCYYGLDWSLSQTQSVWKMRGNYLCGFVEGQNKGFQ